MAKRTWHLAGLALIAGLSVPATAIPLPEPAPRAHWECVPFARAISGVEIYGDARTWWGQAEGRYARGNRPRVGAVLAFVPHGAMQLGHVAVVSGIIDRRTITVSHANWSLINGTRGQIERDVTVRDVSEAGDWSAVRVWYAPLADLGTTAWPVHGFIYGAKKDGGATVPKLAAPQLNYASLGALERHAITPERRLAYLGTLLPQLARNQ
jgi:surface antigen